MSPQLTIRLKILVFEQMQNFLRLACLKAILALVIFLEITDDIFS